MGSLIGVGVALSCVAIVVWLFNNAGLGYSSAAAVPESRQGLCLGQQGPLMPGGQPVGRVPAV